MSDLVFSALRRRLCVSAVQLRLEFKNRRDAETQRRHRENYFARLWMKRTSQYESAAIVAAAGIVRIHAQTIRPATPHFTADNRRVAPTPTIEPVIVCVVETGVPVR